MHECLPNGHLIYSDVLHISCQHRNHGVKHILPAVLRAIGKDAMQDKESLRLLIAGMPNVGKSSLVNALRGVLSSKRSCAQTGDRPGVTRSVQPMIKIHDDPPVYIFDTPGVMIPSMDNQDHAMTLAMLGTLRDELVGEEHIADFLLYTLNRLGMSGYVERYRLPAVSDDISHVLAGIAARVGALQRGGRVDTARAASAFLDDFRKGRLGPFYLGFQHEHTRRRKGAAGGDMGVVAGGAAANDDEENGAAQQAKLTRRNAAHCSSSSNNNNSSSSSNSSSVSTRGAVDLARARLRQRHAEQKESSAASAFADELYGTAGAMTRGDGQGRQKRRVAAATMKKHKKHALEQYMSQRVTK